MPKLTTSMFYQPVSHWHTHRRRNHLPLSRQWQNWLLYPGSLTQRLIQLSKGDFYVTPLYQGWGRATPNEARTLGIPPRHRVWVREVYLVGHGEPWVYARSLIPYSTLRGGQRQLLQLGNKPLGEILFKDPSMQRGPIETARFRCQTQTTWGRRSVFYLHGRPLLVNEVFLPALLQLQ